MEAKNQNIEQRPDNAAPAGNEGNGGSKMFTQDDVNRIVSERLAREREKAGKPDPMEERERALTAREAAMSCKEYISEKKYPAGLLDVFDTSNAECFKAQVDKLFELFPDIDPAAAGKTPVITKGSPIGDIKRNDPIAEAFRPKY